MGFFDRYVYKKSKKFDELTILDAINKKEVTIWMGGKEVKIVAFKLGKMLGMFEMLKVGSDELKAVIAKPELMKDLFSTRLPAILNFCCPGYDLKVEDVTVTEFLDMVTAVWAVNDMERLITNFTKAIPSIPNLIQGMPVSPKS